MDKYKGVFIKYNVFKNYVRVMYYIYIMCNVIFIKYDKRQNFIQCL